MTGGLRAHLARIVGAAHVLTDPDVTAGYGRDWTGRWSARPLAVVRPATVDEVAGVVKACGEAGVGVVPQGGNTGLVGGSVPHRDDADVVLSTARLTRLDECQPWGTRASVVAGAGVNITTLHAHVRASRLTYGVDLASRASATLGGTLATNAGGVRVCRWGDTRRQVLGVQAVLADGTVIDRLGGTVKDSSGYDLSGLLVGSEGTLGVLTAARLVLHPSDSAGVVSLIACADLGAAQALVHQPDVRAAELISAAGLRLVAALDARRPPVDPDAAPWFVLLETGALPEVPDTAQALVGDGLWRWREAQTEALAAVLAASGGIVRKLDVAVAPPLLPELWRRIDALGLVDVTATGVPRGAVGVHAFGHLAEANLHVNVVQGRAEGAANLGQLADAEDAVLSAVVACGGSIAAEHGVGVAKVPWLPRSRGAAEVAAMQAIRRALDPRGVFNPGVLVQ